MKRWSNRKIAVVGLFISIGIVLVILGNAFVTIPSFKTALAGVPVKITGFLLGPLAGGVSGVIVDLLSLLYRPSFYFPGYTLDMIMVGVIPGLVFIVQRRFNRKIAKSELKFKRYNKGMLWMLIISILMVIAIATIFISLIPDDFFHVKVTPKDKTTSTSQLITNKWIYLILIDSQALISLIVILCLKFYFKKNKFNDILPIIVFCFFIEYYLIFSTPLWDQFTIGIPYSFGVSFRITFASLKMWFNVAVMYFVWKVINPLIRIDDIEENNVVTGIETEK